MSANHQEEQVDCPVCMDCIVGNTNKVVTECGHCFHTNCLMANVAHNGFGCPYCRTMMAEEPEEEEEVILIGNDDDDSLNPSMRGLTEDEYCSYLALTSIRYLFREEGEEEEGEYEEEEEEEEEQEYPKPPIEYLVQKLQEEGFTMEMLVKSWLVEHDEYEDIEEDCAREADNIFESLRILISNYTPDPVPVPLPQAINAVPEENKHPIINNFIRSSYV